MNRLGHLLRRIEARGIATTTLIAGTGIQRNDLSRPAFNPSPTQYREVPRWKERQRLSEEKLALGFFFSGHPFHEVKAEVVKFAGPQSDWRGPTAAPKPEAGKHVAYLANDAYPKAVWGLTGSQAQVDAAAKAYRVYHQKVGEGAFGFDRIDLIVAARAGARAEAGSLGIA